MGMSYDTREIDCEDLTGKPGESLFRAVFQCSRGGSTGILDERMNEDTVAHTLIRRVAVNPVTGTVAIAVAVLAVVREGGDAGTSYSQMARAMAADYVVLYYVSLDTERYIQYSPDSEREDLAMERHGEDFFAEARRQALVQLHREDQAAFSLAFTRENVVKTLDSEGVFKMTYRLMIDGKPTYVGMKAVRLPGDSAHIIVGVSNVDAQMREKEALSLIQAEQTIYSRVNALTQGFVCIYTIDPDTGHYMEYRASSAYAGLGVPTSGEDFFSQSQKEGARLIYPEDLPKFQTLLTRENIMSKLQKDGYYAFQYRLLLDGEPRYMSLKAALVEEQDGPVLLIGVNDIDAQVKHEQEYERKLSSARSEANLDVLTGVKNRTAYDNMSKQLAHQIEEGATVEYAIVICRVYGLEWVNDAQGRAAGNQLIREACAIICDIFKHSPVFRVAGDRFAAIVEGHDYDHIDELIAKLETSNQRNAESGGAVVAFGMAKYDGKDSVASVFQRAEAICVDGRT
jgi:GGDEF domain-containing protein